MNNVTNHVYRSVVSKELEQYRSTVSYGGISIFYVDIILSVVEPMYNAVEFRVNKEFW